MNDNPECRSLSSPGDTLPGGEGLFGCNSRTNFEFQWWYCVSVLELFRDVCDQVEGSRGVAFSHTFPMNVSRGHIIDSLPPKTCNGIENLFLFLEVFEIEVLYVSFSIGP